MREGEGRGYAARSATGGLWLTLARGVSFAGNLGAYLVLARIFGDEGPTLFGLLGMAWTALVVAMALSGGGAVFGSLLSDKEVGAARVASAMRLALRYGVLCALVGAAFAPLAGWFYGRPEVTPPILVLAALIPISVVGGVPRVLLQRQFRFSALAAMEVMSVVAAAGAGIALGLAGFGLWALVALRGGRLLLDGVLCLALVRPPLFRPGGASDADGLFEYGRGIVAASVLNAAYREVDDILVGRVWGSAALGHYTIGYRLLVVPLQTVVGSAVDASLAAFGAFASDAARLAQGFLRLLETMTSILFPLYLVTVVLAYDLVTLLLGDVWQPAVPVVRILALAGLIDSVLILSNVLFLARRRTRDLARSMALGAPFVLGGFLVGVPFGPAGVAAGYLMGLLMHAPFRLQRATEGLPLLTRDLAAALVRPALFALCTAGTTALAGLLASRANLSLLARVLAQGATFLVVLGALLFFLEPAVRVLWRGKGRD